MLTNLVIELLKKGIDFDGVELVNDAIAYNITGFAKSGYGTLYQEDGTIKLKTRYNQINDIKSLRDIVEVAYGWDRDYCGKDSIYTVYGVSNAWMKLYEEFEFDTSIF